MNLQRCAIARAERAAGKQLRYAVCVCVCCANTQFLRVLANSMCVPLQQNIRVCTQHHNSRVVYCDFLCLAQFELWFE